MSPLSRAHARFRHFVNRGMLEAVPTAWQMAMGSLIMLPVLYSESPRERVMSRRTLLGQVPLRAPLQALFCPQQALSSTGLLTPRDAIVRHVISVYHEEPALTYDLQLLESHPGGLDALEREAWAVAQGRRRWSRLLTQLVGGAGYHARVAELAAAARRSEYPDTAPLDPRFASVVGFGRFCLGLPDWPPLDFYGFDRDTWRRAPPGAP
jgi:hypothetical protein